MSSKKKIEDIFNDDPFGLLDVRQSASSAMSEDERLILSFNEISDFYDRNKREPELNGEISEYQLYSRLKGIRENPVKIDVLKNHDKYGLLAVKKKEINSLSDIFEDDNELLDDDTEGLFDLKHVKKQEERAIADFVAKRKPCNDFVKYESEFKEIQKDLANGKRRLISFRENHLEENQYFVYNGLLLLLEKIDIEKGLQHFKSGSRVREDGRTRCIFENGTESNLLFRSLMKALYLYGKTVAKDNEGQCEDAVKSLSGITEEDTESGLIYVLKSKSQKEEIKSINDLYKIGYSNTPIEERIKNAEQDPTFLMSPVSVVSVFQCYNLNPQKLEQLLHRFFGNSCLNFDISDKDGRHTPREWFIAPIDIIEKAISLIVSGEIVNYKYDPNKQEIIEKE